MTFKKGEPNPHKGHHVPKFGSFTINAHGRAINKNSGAGPLAKNRCIAMFLTEKQFEMIKRRAIEERLSLSAMTRMIVVDDTVRWLQRHKQ